VAPYQAISDPDVLRSSGLYRVVTPADAVALLGSLDRDSVVTVHPCMGGMPTEVGWTSLELLVDNVLPEIELSPSPYVTQVWAPRGDRQL